MMLNSDQQHQSSHFMPFRSHYSRCLSHSHTVLGECVGRDLHSDSPGFQHQLRSHPARTRHLCAPIASLQRGHHNRARGKHQAPTITQRCSQGRDADGVLCTVCTRPIPTGQGLVHREGHETRVVGEWNLELGSSTSFQVHFPPAGYNYLPEG